MKLPIYMISFLLIGITFVAGDGFLYDNTEIPHLKSEEEATVSVQINGNTGNCSAVGSCDNVTYNNYQNLGTLRYTGNAIIDNGAYSCSYQSAGDLCVDRRLEVDNVARFSSRVGMGEAYDAYARLNVYESKQGSLPQYKPYYGMLIDINHCPTSNKFNSMTGQQIYVEHQSGCSRNQSMNDLIGQKIYVKSSNTNQDKYLRGLDVQVRNYYSPKIYGIDGMMFQAYQNTGGSTLHQMRAISFASGIYPTYSSGLSNVTNYISALETSVGGGITWKYPQYAINVPLLYGWKSNIESYVYNESHLGNVSLGTVYHALLTSVSKDHLAYYYSSEPENIFGIYIENLTATNLSYAIYTNEGELHFGDNATFTDNVIISGGTGNETPKDASLTVYNTTSSNLSIWTQGDIEADAFITHSFFPDDSKDALSILSNIKGINGKPDYETMPDEIKSTRTEPIYRKVEKTIETPKQMCKQVHKKFTYKLINLTLEGEYDKELISTEIEPECVPTLLNKVYEGMIFYDCELSEECTTNGTTVEVFTDYEIVGYQEVEGTQIDKLSAYNTKAIQELLDRIEELEAKVTALETGGIK